VASRRRLGGRALLWLRWGVVGGVFALAVGGSSTFLAVEQSSQPEFCNTCHIMEPYYESWERSAHSGIKCIECHFEPGTLGTVRGKFQALSQLAKYVTRTAGTRPWAEVSDMSCVRSGCHSMGSLQGPLDFDGVAFDHTPHLLETRGKRLRCVTCHTQVLVDQHFAVEPTICSTCHFMPGADGRVPERTSDCMVCHRAPTEPIEVAGRPFEHAGYVARGVDCRDCHADVVQGTGTVYPQRCRSCHGQPELLAQIGDSDLLHRAHVSERKVECFECHVEIHHGQGESGPAHPGAESVCSGCHAETHQAALQLAAGLGGTQAGAPSRMRETHVACRACHSGRSGDSGGLLAAAGEVDCLHCHGVGYAGLLAEWQRAIGGGLEALTPLADELSARLTASSPGDPAPGDRAARELLSAVQADLQLLRRDGSRGVHNPAFAQELLRASAGRLGQAWQPLDPARAARAASALPPAPDAACAACHLDVGGRDPLSVHGRPFQHDAHLRAAGLGCSVCHVPEPLGSPGHGQPAFPREQCASCHHTESATLDPSDCARCHPAQQAFLTGELAEAADVTPLLAEKDCTSCHGEPPDLMIPPGSLCVLCHEEGYDAKLEEWRTTTDRLEAELRARLAAPPAGATPEALQGARRALELVEGDGSRGVHDFPLAEHLLRAALEPLGPQ